MTEEVQMDGTFAPVPALPEALAQLLLITIFIYNNVSSLRQTNSFKLV